MEDKEEVYEEEDMAVKFHVGMDIEVMVHNVQPQNPSLEMVADYGNTWVPATITEYNYNKCNYNKCNYNKCNYGKCGISFKGHVMDGRAIARGRPSKYEISTEFIRLK
jgi:hypothetical protein